MSRIKFNSVPAAAPRSVLFCAREDPITELLSPRVLFRVFNLDTTVKLDATRASNDALRAHEGNRKHYGLTE